MADSSILSFVELMEKQPSYEPMMDKRVKYQLTELYNGRYWSLAIKGNQPDLPYVTVELILSDDGKTIVRAVRLVDYKEDKLQLLSPTPVGTYGPDKTLRELCQIADETFEEVFDNKWQEFSKHLVDNLKFQVELPTMTTSYYTIEVEHGSGYQECYLGTQFNDMRFAPDFPHGNIAVYWKCNPDARSTSVINAVTERSPDPTYLNPGDPISGQPNTYPVNLAGPAHNFNFINSGDHFNAYAIATTARRGTMAFLMPQRSGEIVAKAGVIHPYIFRVTPQPQYPPS